jgi:hypothetical protein
MYASILKHDFAKALTSAIITSPRHKHMNWLVCGRMANNECGALEVDGNDVITGAIANAVGRAAAPEGAI